jgi:DNA-binding transcriptional ArsR family regulator
MKTGPDIARIAVLIGDPARANMLTALHSGVALTASELAAEAGITKQTASAHLAKLLDAQLLAVEQQGRHRYFRLEGEDVSDLLETLTGVAEQRGARRVRTGPREPALRRARVCYNHLAGDLGVGLFDALRANKWIAVDGHDVAVPKKGRSALADFGIDVVALEGDRRPLCRTCLDWSVRRSHLAGSVATAILDQVFARKWAKRVTGTRIVEFSNAGERAFTAAFKMQAAR